jgi:hypothetical protein
MTIQLSEQDIRERAYALWEARGRPEGSAEEDWRAAEQQLRAELDAVESPLPPLGTKAAKTLDDDVTIAKPRARPRPRRSIQPSPSQD